MQELKPIRDACKSGATQTQPTWAGWIRSGLDSTKSLPFIWIQWFTCLTIARSNSRRWRALFVRKYLQTWPNQKRGKGDSEVEERGKKWYFAIIYCLLIIYCAQCFREASHGWLGLPLPQARENRSERVGEKADPTHHNKCSHWELNNSLIRSARLLFKRREFANGKPETIWTQDNKRSQTQHEFNQVSAFQVQE